ncbi:nicotinate-nucleotide--dimethylbenzimidazole phosphoribosyltransferase [Streptomyces piniterrae]|uniref:Nicotinate-nucleotide--dimethylbenzimidazole phosphoribosyltransferase n=1 Tax=Streptomyces piniterrae TaxID=2571125 RepID=A0A4U0MMD4_9ACTN|nr:nicotinate-nucleotide--dimethylbenzimidazole phosphoribosyltransferase [Streptomyces piniterrae]TJZ41905.1 nicotinate-nucleotide--dimethylbenzimidazole phosphoribosyltransferase [Streptomyces piniterrae]
MTDTGQVPGEGQPENAGGHPGQPQPAAVPSPADAGPMEQPGPPPAPDAYPYLDPADGAAEDDDLLLMPGAQGAWSEQQPQQPLPQPHETHHQIPAQQQRQQGAAEQGAPYAAPGTAGFEPMPAQAGDHESGGRDSGAVDLSAVRIPQPTSPHPAAPQQQAGGPARRPLHMGPPMPDTTGGVVRSLADRGPAGTPPQTPARHAGGPEYFDAPAEGPATAQAAPAEQPVAAPPAEPQPPQAQAVEAQPAQAQPLDAQPAPAQQPYPEQNFTDVAYAEQPPAAPPYGEQTYGGQVYAEQSYGATGQGPLPGPQLGEIPSQVPPWGEASAQAVAAPHAETVDPGAMTGVPAEAAAVPAGEAVPQVPQDAQPLAGQPMPVPVPGAPEAPEGVAVVADAGAAAAVAAPQAVVTDAPEAVQEAPDAAAPAEQPAAPAEAQQLADPGQAVVEAEAAAQPADAQALVDPAVPAEAPAEAQPQQATVDQTPQVVGAVGEAVPSAEPAQPGPADAPRAGAETVAPAQPVAAVEGQQPPVAQAAGGAPAGAAIPMPAAPQGPIAMPPAKTGAAEAQAVIEQPEAPLPDAGQPQPVAHGEAPNPEAAPQDQDTPAEQQPVPPVAHDTHEADAPQDAPVAADVAPDGTVPTTDDAPAEPLPAGAADETAQAAESAEPVAPEAAAAPQQVPAPAEAEGTEQPSDDTAQEQPTAEGDQPETPAAPADDTSMDDAASEAAPHQDGAELVQLGEGHEGHDGDAAAATGEDHQPQAADQPVPEAAPHQDGPMADDGTHTDGIPVQAPAAGYDDSERAAVHRVMRERRDIRNGFRGDPIPNDVLLRVLEAAHTAPSVGHSQPWDFVVIRSAETREKMHQLAMQQREAYAKSLPKARAKQFRELKIEAILDTPVNIVVTADSTRGGRHTLGRHTQPQMAPYSSALAVENLWLAARAEGLGVGWVSFFDEREMVRELGLPEHLEVVAYLCVGYVDEFPDEPELLQAGWSKRRPLSWVVHEETYGRRALPGEDPHDLLQETLQGIRPLDAKALGEAWERQKRMTKPAGALGMLEIISAQLSGLSRKCPPPIPEPAAVAIFAGDHGVHAQGVTPWPQEVTGQMVANFLGGGAVCNAFANQVGAEVCVVDVGVAGDLPATPGLLPRKVRAGTDDFTAGPAMTQEDVLKAIEVGIETARDLVAAGNKVLLTGEMGIANTTTSAALIAVYTGADPTEVTGRGTGINDETHARKVDVVRRALELHQPDPADPVGVLAAVGGLEHAALVGLILGGASLRTPVILDGVSAGAAALVARAIAPEALAACIAGHRSAEPGHVAALTKLGLRPLVDLDLRLGEGTGALLALPVVQSAARAMHEVATFDSAGVTEKS